MTAIKMTAWALLAVATLVRILSVYPELVDFSRPMTAEYFNRPGLPYLFILREGTEEKVHAPPAIRWRGRAFIAKSRGGEESWAYSPARASVLVAPPQSLFWQSFFVFDSNENRVYALSPGSGNLQWVAYFPCPVDRISTRNSQLKVECGGRSFEIGADLAVTAKE